MEGLDVLQGQLRRNWADEFTELPPSDDIKTIRFITEEQRVRAGQRTEEGEVSDSSVSKARKERHSPSKAQADTSDDELGEKDEERLSVVPQPTLAVVKRTRVESPPLEKGRPSINFEGIETAMVDKKGTQHIHIHHKRDLKIILTDKHEAEQFKALLFKTQSNNDGS